MGWSSQKCGQEDRWAQDFGVWEIHSPDEWGTNDGHDIIYTWGSLFVCSLGSIHFCTSTDLRFCSCGAPSKFRDITGNIAKLTGGRCFSVKYRLAPQNPFPAAILDVLVAYLSLLYPPSGAFHTPALASSIVLAGDSSGANICLAVLQLILYLRHQSLDGDSKIGFHGKQVSLPLPAGFASLSISADLTHSQCSWTANAMHDVLPNEPPPIRSSQPSCDIWPSKPPRGDLYGDLSAICHPLVSPTAAVDWRGAPPMRFSCGEEMLADEGAIIARHAAIQGVCAVWEQFEAMPHSFVGYLGWLPQTIQCLRHWADFCLQCV